MLNPFVTNLCCWCFLLFMPPENTSKPLIFYVFWGNEIETLARNVFKKCYEGLSFSLGSLHNIFLTLSWRMSLSYRPQSIDLQSKCKALQSDNENWNHSFIKNLDESLGTRDYGKLNRVLITHFFFQATSNKRFVDNSPCKNQIDWVSRWARLRNR